MARRPRDDTDRKLIALLQADARQATAALGKTLGIARTTVHERLARLERDEVIIGYTALLGRDPTEERAEAIVMLALAQRQQKAVVERLSAFPEVKLCLTVSGDFDLFLLVEAPRLEDLDALLDEVQAVPGVERSRSSIVLTTKFDRRAIGRTGTVTPKV